MSYLIIDIETRPDSKLTDTLFSNLTPPKNYKDEAKIAEWLESKKQEARKMMSVDPDYNEIACIGVKVDDEPAKIVKITKLKGLMKNAGKVITFNGKNFDFPTLIKNGLKQKVKLPYKTLNEGMKKWKSEWHIDLMEVISAGRDYKSLDEYLQIYFGEKKTPCDFETCTQEELERHCLEDVENTYKLYKLFEPIL